MVHSNDDSMNKIPLKSSTGLDDEEKNGGEFIHDTTAAEEARREQMRANVLKWMKKLTIVLICFIGIALISYVIISLCFSDDKSTNNNNASSVNNNASALLNNNINDNSTSQLNATAIAALGITDKHTADTTTTASITTASAASATPSPSSPSSPSWSASSPLSTSTSSLPATTTTTATKAVTEAPLVALLQDKPVAEPKFESKLGVYEKAAVCSDREVCSQIGSNLLALGGTAVDAAIGALLCNGVVNMHSMGIGGGMLMNVYIKKSKHAYAIDAREVAPFSAEPDMFDQDLKLSLHGGQSIAVPGELMGYYRAHERFGKLSWKELVEPSVKLCNEGFYITRHQYNALKYKLEHVKNNTVLTNVFLDPATGDIHAPGTKLKPLKELCATYALLQESGPLDFYNGTLAKMVADDLEDLGSKVTIYDLESYNADLVSSITMQLGDDILYSVPPVSSGTVVANILSVLEGYNFTKADLAGAQQEANTIHRFVEAMKFGFAKRWELGDLRFNDVRELVSKLTNPEYNVDIRAQINDSTVLNDIFDYGAQFHGVDDVGTSHLVVLAPNGDAVSVTSSVNDYFGCGQAGKRTGIIFNSGMNDFSIGGHSNAFGLPPAPSNTIEARKRAMSSMSPMILADRHGDIRMAFGAAGGSKIISAIIEVAARVLWFGQNIKEAIDAPRFHHQLLPNVLQYQKDGFTEEVISLLEAKGHKVESFSDIGSVVCGIVRNSTAIYANADYRKRGGIAGF